VCALEYDGIPAHSNRILLTDIVYQIIASDLDGTLLDGNHMVDAFTSDTLCQLAGQGLHFVLATGRHFLDVKGIRAALGIRAHLITSNGASIHDPDDQQIYSKYLDPQLVQALAQAEFAAGSRLNFYLNDSWLIDQPNARLLSMHKDSGFTYQVCDLAAHDGQNVEKVLYVAEHAQLLQIEQRIKARFDSIASITFSSETCLEVMAPGVSKGSALQQVLDRLKLKAEHCLAFGDGQNDVEMLQLAGHPRIMGVAHPRLVSSLPHATRISSNLDAGVARHLRQLFKLA
jgi:Cof subfamily protein (haloacid dehalogenase superfamily)